MTPCASLANPLLMLKTYYISNAQVVLPKAIIPQTTIVVQGKKIVALSQGRGIPKQAIEIDAQGNFVAPGFIDLHIHGAVEEISRQQVKGGTTGFLATLHPERAKALLENIGQVLTQRKEVTGAKVLGLRLEGPFLNRAFCGALPPKLLRQPNINQAKKIIRASGGFLKMMIIAPELKEALKLIRLLKRHKIVVSLGHSGASYAQALRGIEAGISHATHTFNRMRGFDHRAPGALGALLTDDRVGCEVIAEGIHVHPGALRLLKNCKGLDKMMLVTDSTAAQKYPVKRRQGDVFRLKDGTLYGTALTLNKALKNAVQFLGLGIPEAVRLITLNPAKVLQLDKKKGSISPAKDADLVIFDKNFKIKMTMVEGKIVYKN